MQVYAQEICRTRFFVGLRIEVDAPGVLAAIRPCSYKLRAYKTKKVYFGSKCFEPYCRYIFSFILTLDLSMLVGVSRE